MGPAKKPMKEVEEPTAPLELYSKSLKLLGLDIPSNRKEAVKVTHKEIQLETKEPTMKTRLTKKSESHSDIKAALTTEIKESEFNAMRSTLKDAVFEEWYFKKC